MPDQTNTFICVVFSIGESAPSVKDFRGIHVKPNVSKRNTPKLLTSINLCGFSKQLLTCDDNTIDYGACGHLRY